MFLIASVAASLAGCASSNNPPPPVNLPAYPAHIAANVGKLTAIPAGKALTNKQAEKLLLALRKNEIKKDRLLKQAGAFYADVKTRTEAKFKGTK